MMALTSPWMYFTDPVLRGPTIGCMLMCLAASLVGVLVFLRKESLVGEALSHASYPGVILGAVLAGGLNLDESSEGLISLLVISGAFLTALGALWTIHYLEIFFKIRSDSALCFTLALFFGVGLTMASHVQFAYPRFYRQVQAYLYGQAATMTDVHILIYGLLSLLIVMTLILFQKELKVIIFDRTYAKTLGLSVHRLDALFFTLIVLAIVIGIRSVGVVLMSAMIIAPAVAARQFTNHLSKMFYLSAFFGLASGFLGNYLSIELQGSRNLVLPTGPMIVLVSTTLCLFSLLFAFERGLLLRNLRVLKFRFRCQTENLLKTFWYLGSDRIHSFRDLLKYHHFYPIYMQMLLRNLIKNGWVKKIQGGYQLTYFGKQRAAKIIRLHRLWEVYLVDFLGVGVEKVHRNAEEMEHILTPELEKELTKLLHHPKKDPHQQPIPKNIL